MNSGILKAAILQILEEKEAEPAPEKYLMLALTVQYRIKVTYSDLRSTMKNMDEKGLLVGVTDDDDVVTWSLSTRGKHKVRSL